MTMYNNIYKRYVYLSIGTVTLLFFGLIYAWSLFKKPLSDDFSSLGSFNLSMTFTISIIFFCLGGFFSGKLAGVIGYKKRLLLAALMIFIGFFCLSQLKPENQEHIVLKLYLLYGFFCGFGFGIGYNTTISAILPWFPDRIGFASGVLLMGFGFGGMIIGSAVNYILSKSGVSSSFLAISVIMPLTVVIATILLKEPSESEVAALKAQLPAKGNSHCVSERGPSEMLRSSFFWWYTAWNLLLTSSGLLVVNSAAQIVMSFGAPAVLGLIVSVFNGAGRVIIGTLFDRVGGAKTSFVNGCCLLTAGCSLYTGSATGSLVFIVAGLVFCGISFGGIPSITSAWIKHSFGARYYPVNFSIANFSLIPSAIIGPLFSGYLFDKSGGSYNSAFLMIIIFAAVTLLLSLLLARLEKRL